MAGHRLKCPQARMMFYPQNTSFHIKVALLHSPALSFINQECLLKLEGPDLLWRHIGDVHIIKVPTGHEWKVPTDIPTAFLKPKTSPHDAESTKPVMQKGSS